MKIFVLVARNGNPRAGCYGWHYDDRCRMRSEFDDVSAIVKLIVVLLSQHCWAVCTWKHTITNRALCYWRTSATVVGQLDVDIENRALCYWRISATVVGQLDVDIENRQLYVLLSCSIHQPLLHLLAMSKPHCVQIKPNFVHNRTEESAEGMWVCGR